MGNGLSVTEKKKGAMSNRVDAANSYSHVYHEKQVKEFCAIHAMNNLLQNKDAFTKKSLDKICYDLSPGYFINPHKSMFGTGNYDVNVIMKAMHTKGLEVLWFDKRKRISELNLANIVGFILNTPSDYKLGGIIPITFNRKHWIAITQVDQYYYNLDSKLSLPVCIGGESDVQIFLQEQIGHAEKEILFVVTEEVQKSGSWKLDCNSNSDSVLTTTSQEKSSHDQCGARTKCVEQERINLNADTSTDINNTVDSVVSNGSPAQSSV